MNFKNHLTSKYLNKVQAKSSPEYRAARLLHDQFVPVFLEIQDSLNTLASPDKTIKSEERKKAKHAHKLMLKFMDEFDAFLKKID